ncbi:GNAT family N-acetyltransferase [Vibrio sp. WXL210]|uniref:GNAT family N-acetyltransferase n=1 Tax=Vibrio sp. WXL210 TaxID=3450709 RepID=UPI003EC4BFD6
MSVLKYIQPSIGMPRKNIHFREITAGDETLQKTMLLVALWTPDDQPDHDVSILELPTIKEYYHDWGREGDFGLFALNIDQQPIGLVQIRYKSCPTKQFSSFPELAISVLPEYQGQGVASALLDELLVRTRCLDTGIRLGVHPDNHLAISLYKRFGFSVYEIASSSYPQMIRLSQ